MPTDEEFNERLNTRRLMGDTDAAADRRRLAAEKDTHTAIQIVELRGTIHEQGTVNKQRFDQLDGSIKETKTEINARIDKHEELETPKINAMQRLIWIAVGAVVILAGVVAFGLEALKQSMFK